MTINMPITEGFTTQVSFPEKPSIYQTKIHPRSYNQFVPQGNSACMLPVDEDCIPISSGKLLPKRVYLLINQATALYGKAKVEFFYCAELLRIYKFSESGGQKSYWQMTSHSISVSIPGLSRDEVIEILQNVAQMANVVSHIVADYFAFTREELHSMFVKDNPIPLEISNAWGEGKITTPETIGYTCLILPPPLPVYSRHHERNHNKKLKRQAKLAATAALPS